MSFDKMHLFAASLAPRYERIRECIRMSVLTSTPNGIYNKHVPSEWGGKRQRALRLCNTETIESEQE